ncbi:MAG TPA: DUF192 domain-containing protein [Casimicrobiaceae bacterium]|jgi:uncharacterized membrane protein (UPF0127 family)|nr:DUF192 domain-containing protein [Casimicrobiaceae bacterium]
MTRLRASALVVFALAALAALPLPAATPPDAVKDTAAHRVNSGLARISIDVGGRAIRVEVADSAGVRETGLMNRFSIPADEGMLFVFPVPQPLAFWMHDTYMPLSIAFIDAEGRILNIEEMAPRSDATHLSHGEALYALEMRQGWFRRHGIEPGAFVTHLPKPSRD